MSITSIHSPIF